MKEYVYADNAATTKLDKDAFEAMIPWLIDEYGNAPQPYAFSRKPRQALEEARATIAACVNALPEEIYFTSGGTESDNWAIKGSAFADCDHQTTITSLLEHHAVLHACEAIEKMNYPVVYMRPTNSGYILPDILENHINKKTRLVSVMLANNELGTIQPIKELCKIAHAHGAIFHTDAVQAVGHIKIDVRELDVDMLSASAHKFNGPKGVGFLYIKKGVTIHPYIDGGAQENRMRAGTENIASIVGMAVALKNNCDALEANIKHIMHLERILIRELNEAGINYVRNGGASKLPGFVSLSFPRKDGEVILHRMDLMGIGISTGSACNSVNKEVSHVLKAIRLDESLAKGTIRISLGKYNTEEHVYKIVDALKRIVK